jgi:hypothetical protein
VRIVSRHGRWSCRARQAVGVVPRAARLWARVQGRHFPGKQGSKGATLLWAGIRKGGMSLRGGLGDPPGESGVQGTALKSPRRGHIAGAMYNLAIQPSSAFFCLCGAGGQIFPRCTKRVSRSQPSLRGTSRDRI